MVGRSTQFAAGLRFDSAAKNYILPRARPAKETEPVFGEIVDPGQRVSCRQQVTARLEPVAVLLEKLMQPGSRIDDEARENGLSERAIQEIHRISGNITSIRRMISALNDLCAEMARPTGTAERGRRTRYFAFSPTDDGLLIFVSSATYLPFEDWLDGLAIQHAGRSYRLVVVGDNSRENVHLMGTQPPAKIVIKK